MIIVTLDIMLLLSKVLSDTTGNAYQQGDDPHTHMMDTYIVMDLSIILQTIQHYSPLKMIMVVDRVVVLM